MKRYMVFDYETRAKRNIKLVGAHEYAVPPDTEVLCVAWKIGTRETLLKAKTHVWNVKLDPDNEISLELERALSDPSIIKVAHNAGFEQVITKYVLPRHVGRSFEIDTRHWICTAALAAAHALPRTLEGACEVLKLPVQKDPMGKKLIRTHCVPQRLTKTRTSIWNDDPKGLNRLAQYCATDVDAEAHLLLALPPLTPREHEVWRLNQFLNTRGVAVDRKLVAAALKMIAEEERELQREAKALTGGISPTQVAAVRTWLKGQGLALPNLQKKTVEDALGAGLGSDRARRLLQIRQAISKTSTKKYVAFECRSRSDGRLRDLQLYHGASTGREAGMGVQPHNFPRGSLPPETPMEAACAIVASGDRAWVRALIGEPMAAFSSVLRGVIQASPGNTLFAGDFNAIEARVLFWVARHDAGLQMFEADADLYVDLAGVIFDKAPAAVTEDERFVGKQGILGCGFGMGDVRFIVQCANFGREISPALSKKTIKAYRTKHHPVPRLWNNVERAAIAAVKNRGKRYTVNRTSWFVSGKFLYVELPSGRRLAYAYPSVKVRMNRWKQKKETLHFWAVHAKTKKWCEHHTWGGTLTENVVQAIARDCMVEAQLRTWRAGFIPLMSVHDELIAETANRHLTLEQFEKLMSVRPKWAPELPIKVKAWQGLRYKK
jgi:DNA polymerase